MNGGIASSREPNQAISVQGRLCNSSALSCRACCVLACLHCVAVEPAPLHNSQAKASLPLPVMACCLQVVYHWFPLGGLASVPQLDGVRDGFPPRLAVVTSAVRRRPAIVNLCSACHMPALAVTQVAVESRIDVHAHVNPWCSWYAGLDMLCGQGDS